MVKVQEQNYREAHRDLTNMKSRYNMGTAFASMAITYAINSFFWNKVSAKLPFEPLGMVSGMSHRGLEGADMSQVSMTFLCILF